MSAHLWLISEMLMLLTLAVASFFALGWRWQGQRARAQVSTLEARLDRESALAKLATEQREELLNRSSVHEALVGELKEAEERQHVLEREMLRLRDEKKEVEQVLARDNKVSDEPEPLTTDRPTPSQQAVVLERDDLTQVRGIGKVLSEKLGDAGLTSYRQLARLSEVEVEALDVQLNLRGRMQRDRWQEQAQALHEELYGKAMG